MRKLRLSDAPARQSTAAERKKGNLRRFLSAALMAGSVLASSQASAEKPKPSLLSMRAVAFVDAKANPGLRQAYLDSRAQELRNECTAGIIYDHNGKKSTSRCISIDKGCLGGFRLGIGQKNAEVIANERMFGQGRKMDIYVFPNAFRGEEESLATIIRVHEGTHACDVFYGIRAGGAVFGHGRLKYVYPFVLTAVLEVRASGNVLRNAISGDWEKERIACQIPNFHRNFMDLLDYRAFRGNGNGPLVDKTLEDYGDVVQALNAKINAAIEAEKMKKRR